MKQLKKVKLGIELMSFVIGDSNTKYLKLNFFFLMFLYGFSFMHFPIFASFHQKFCFTLGYSMKH